MRMVILGIHPVPNSAEPCHLIELAIEGTGDVEFGVITQRDPLRPRSSWQVPYDEYLLTPAGDSGSPLSLGAPLHVDGSARVAFFIHYLDTARPLETEHGMLALPAPTERPDRLSFITYEAPC